MNRRLSAALRLLPLAWVLAACTDRTPVSGITEPPAPAAMRLSCTVRVRTGAMECGAPASRARGELMLGGGYVKLASSGTAYDGAGTLRSDVTVQNLTPQAIGTLDGTSPAPEGVRVFFAGAPTVTAGSGTVTLQNPDGTGTFTASDQPFIRYAQVLAPNETSVPREWRFDVPATVETFTFVVYVAAPAADETGKVDVAPAHPSLPVGASRALTATVRTGAGRATGEAVTWFSTDSTVARVDANGTVTAVGAGTATVVAVSGARSGYTDVSVYAGDGDVTPPTLEALSFTPGAVDVRDAADTVDLTLTVSDDQAGVFTGIGVVFRSPSRTSYASTGNCTRVSGTAQHGTYDCPILVRRFVQGGTWTIDVLELDDVLQHHRYYSAAELRAAGLPVTLQVTSTEDAAAPVLTGFSLSPDSVDVRTKSDTVDGYLSLTDDASGVSTFISVMLRSPSQASYADNGTCERTSGTDTGGTWHCALLVRQWVEPGTWTVDHVVVEDRVGNRRALTAADLQGSGFPSTVKVASVRDTAAPVLTGLSVSPDSVDVSAGTVVATLSLSLADEGSGVSYIFARYVSPTGSTMTYNGACDLVSGTVNTGTYQCPVRFGQFSEAGTWTLDSVVLEDRVVNRRVLTATQLQAMGVPMQVKVTN